jgi:histone arginine demethylase JMJD6
MSPHPHHFLRESPRRATENLGCAAEDDEPTLMLALGSLETMNPFVHDDTVQYTINRAKRNLAPHKNLADWQASADASAKKDFIGSVTTTSVTLDSGKTFRCNTPRIPCSDFDDIHGDTLPNTPTVLTGCCDDWKALRCWSSVEDGLASRYSQLVSLDGGPSWARMSMSSAKVSLLEYQRYCANNADGDATPLYVFDPDFLKPDSLFANGDSVTAEFSVPPCFSHDEMACCTGSSFRPLPPAWLLVGAKSSGTPIHNHPMTVAWNALLSGCKLWCCLPPNVPERFLLLNLEDDDDDDDDDEQESAFDISALEWFGQCGALPENAYVIVQRPGEVVFLPAGWFHVVLNIELSTAMSFSLALRKDFPELMPLLKESDPEFAAFWLDQLAKERKDTGTSASSV